jgi:hypothetical protein
MAKRSYRDLLYFLDVARAIYGIILKSQGSSWESMECGLISQRGWGLTAKLVGIFLVSDLFSNEKLP